MKANILLSLFLVTACAPSLIGDVPDSDNPGVEEEVPFEATDLVREVLDDGWMLRINALDERVAVLVDLDTRYTTEGEDWDISLVRYEPFVHEDAAVIALDGVAADSVDTWDDADWAYGAAGAEVLNTWWDYNIETHIVTPSDTTFVVLTGEGDVFALRFEDYYADAGTPATMDVLMLPVVKDDAE